MIVCYSVQYDISRMSPSHLPVLGAEVEHFYIAPFDLFFSLGNIIADLRNRQTVSVMDMRKRYSGISLVLAILHLTILTKV